MHNPFNTDEYYEHSKKPFISPLEFDFIPPHDSEPDREMADGGTIPFSTSSSEEDARIDALIQRELKEEKRRLNVQQSIGTDEGGLSGDVDEESVDAGINTVAGTVAAAMAAAISVSESLGPTQAVLQMTGWKPATDVTGLRTKGRKDYIPSEKSPKALAKLAEEEEIEDVVSEMTGLQHGMSAYGSEGEDPYGDPEETEGLGTASGGLIKGYQDGDMVEEQADTTMDTAGLGPMGLVDDIRGDQVTGVEDDLEMDTEEGAYVLNADTVELIGLKDLNNLVKEAIDVAIGSDIPLPKKIDPTKKVPIKISNGEFIIPAILVPIIGLENLEKMNKRGLAYREKNREQEAPAEVPMEIAEEQAPMETSPEGIINLQEGGQANVSPASAAVSTASTAVSDAVSGASEAGVVGSPAVDDAMGNLAAAQSVETSMAEENPVGWFAMVNRAADAARAQNPSLTKGNAFGAGHTAMTNLDTDNVGGVIGGMYGRIGSAAAKAAGLAGLSVEDSSFSSDEGLGEDEEKVIKNKKNSYLNELYLNSKLRNKKEIGT
jgi:hypothetical protein